MCGSPVVACAAQEPPTAELLHSHLGHRNSSTAPAGPSGASWNFVTFGFALHTMKTRPLLLTTRQASQSRFTADRTLMLGPAEPQDVTDQFASAAYYNCCLSIVQVSD